MMGHSPLIVLATDSAVPSGVGEHMLTLAGALAPAYDVALAFFPDGEGARFLARAAAAGFETVALGEKFPAWLGTRRPAILHVHAGIGWEGHELVETGANCAIPVVRTEHLPYMLTDPEQKSRHRMAAGLVDRLVVVSDAAAESYRAQGFLGIATIRNGIDAPVPRGGRDRTRAALGIADETRIVITVARFTAQKGHEILLHAAAEVSRTMPHAVFLLVGEGPERSAMQALAAALDLPNVVFLGQRADVPDLLAAADLFVLPSLFEGLPLVVLEAMALALPVVATRVCGTAEALGAHHPFLVPPGDPASLAGAIAAALGDETATGLGGRRRFEDLFTAARMGRETAALYGGVTERMRVA